MRFFESCVTGTKYFRKIHKPSSAGTLRPLELTIVSVWSKTFKTLVMSALEKQNYALHSFVVSRSWSVNSISISGMLTPSHLAGQKVKPRWPSMKGNFVGQFQYSSRSYTSVPVLCTASVISFCLVRPQSMPNYGKSIQDEMLLDQFYIIEYSKGFKMLCGQTC